ncbi:MAG: response regulator [Chitinophagaceae bacterium]|nr:response regulator [Chitinophagaceae bacterium]
MSRLLRYSLLIVFFAAILVIVFLQFNTNRNIDRLIDGNDEILEELDLKDDLQILHTNLFTLESKIRGIIIRGEKVNTDTLQNEFDSVNQLLQKIVLAYDTIKAPPVNEFVSLVTRKIAINKTAFEIFNASGKTAAEKYIISSKSSVLTDSIKQKAREADALHDLLARKLITEADRGGLRAKTMGTVVAIIAALASIFTFLYIIFKLRQQQIMIKQLDESEKKAREVAQIKENFMANMSHEIRTPMNAILGFTNILKRKNLDEESEHHVQTIQESSESLLHIINDILDLSKIEAGMLKIETAPFSIRNTVHTVEAMLKSKTDEKELDFSVSIDNTLPDILEGDATRLSQILINLISNAIKFTEKGSITLNVANEGIEDQMISLRITVSDTGIGIKNEDLNTIFDRFQQAEDSVSRKFGGTGLGLSIVKELTVLQNGSISVDSETGKGSTFNITIPYRISKEKNLPLVENITFEVPGDTFEKANILVAEDNEINQSLIKYLLNEWKIRADFVENGKEAIRLLQQQNYDLILMDIQMPEMDGYSATKEIREVLKYKTPIIAMTAHALAGEKDKCLQAGMNGYLPKPIRDKQLYNTIVKFLNIESKTVKPAETVNSKPAPSFKTINLGYMREISSGNKEYEKLVTEQFLESVPDELVSIKNAWNDGSIKELRQLAHNMKTTISIMGLTDSLNPHLDFLEHEPLDAMSFRNHYETIETICTMAIEEATGFYKTL